MDSLRLILIILGVLIVAGIYLWTRQRARLASELQDDLFTPPRDTRDDWDIIPVVRTAAEPASDAALADLSGMTGEAHIAMNPVQPAAEAAPARDERTEPGWGVAALDTVADPAPEERLEPSWSDNEVEAAAAQEQQEQVAEAPASAPAEQMLVVLSVMAPAGEMFDGPAVFEALQRADLRLGDMSIFHWHEPARGTAVFSLANSVEPGTFDRAQMGGMHTPGVVLFMQLPGPLAGGAAFDLMIETARLLAAELGGRVCDQSRRPITEPAVAELRDRANRIAARS